MSVSVLSSVRVWGARNFSVWAPALTKVRGAKNTQGPIS